MPMPKLYVTPDMQPNAFATGRNPHHAAVAVTQGIIQILDWDELRGVLAHEMSHIRNRDILIGSVAAAVAMGITFVARMAMWGAMFGGGGDDDDGGNAIGVLALAILAPIAAGLLQMALSRSREFEADRTGARLIGDGEPLARALEKLEADRQAGPDGHRPGPRQRLHHQPADRPQGPVRQPLPHPPAHRGASRPPAQPRVAVAARQSRKFVNCKGMPKSFSLQRRDH